MAESVSARLTGAQSDAVVVSVGSGERLIIRAVHLSVPAGQNAILEFGSTTVMATETQVNLVLQRPIRGADGVDLTVTSSGNVSYFIEYEK